MRLVAVALFIISVYSLISYSCEVKDDLGRIVKLTHPAQRIVSLAPDLTENLFAVGVGDRIVGVMQGSDYPLPAKKIPVIARYQSVDVEALLVLHPDLIVVWADGITISKLEKWGIPVYVSRPKKLMDIPYTLIRLGCLVGNEKIAQEAANVYSQRYLDLAKQKRYTQSPRVFYQIWSQPLMTITKQSWINEAITFCGAENIFADLKGIAPEVTAESIVVNDPDIIVGAYKDNHWKKFWQSWSNLRAVKNHAMVTLDPDLIERASPRLLDGVSQLCELIANTRKDAYVSH